MAIDLLWSFGNGIQAGLDLIFTSYVYLMAILYPNYNYFDTFVFKENNENCRLVFDALLPLRDSDGKLTFHMFSFDFNTFCGVSGPTIASSHGST